MISKILGVGNKIELTRTIASENMEYAKNQNRVFVSQILDIIDDEKLKISMPIEHGKIIPLPVNSRFDACFYTSGGLYQGRITVRDRYKEGQIFVLVVEIASSLQKYQRRQYYRLGCVIDIQYRIISGEEVEEYGKNSNLIIQNEDFYEGTAIDISGGGIRFVSRQKLEKNREIFMILEITYEEQTKIYGLMGRVIISCEARRGHGLYEHRIEFINMQGGVRESLIKYIFEEERRRRKRENSLYEDI